MKKKPYLLCAVVAAAVLTGCAGPAPVEVIASCEESTACVAETIPEISTQTAEAAAKIIESGCRPWPKGGG